VRIIGGHIASATAAAIFTASCLAVLLLLGSALVLAVLKLAVGLVAGTVSGTCVCGSACTVNGAAATGTAIGSGGAVTGTGRGAAVAFGAAMVLDTWCNTWPS
jgi:hypothetical protein